jgi:outer membrane protein assembly factor BamB
MEGELNWQRILGAFTSQHGFGVSLMVYHDLIILPKDMMGSSSIMAFEKQTGKPVWTIPRKERKTSYATPMILQREGFPDQLITVSGASGISAHVPETGEVIWTTEEFPQRTVASPILAGGLIVASCGGGGRGSNLWAISPDGIGDVTQTHIKYERKKELPYVPTPISYGDWLFLLNDQGLLSCVEASTGKNLFTERAFEGTTTVSSSMVCIDGKLYCVDESGNVAVIEAGPEFKILGKSTLGDRSHATPAVAGGRLFFRTFERLMCLEAEEGR